MFESLILVSVQTPSQHVSSKFCNVDTDGTIRRISSAYSMTSTPMLIPEDVSVTGMASKGHFGFYIIGQ